MTLPSSWEERVDLVPVNRFPIERSCSYYCLLLDNLLGHRIKFVHSNRRYAPLAFNTARPGFMMFAYRFAFALDIDIPATFRSAFEVLSL